MDQGSWNQFWKDNVIEATVMQKLQTLQYDRR